QRFPERRGQRRLPRPLPWQHSGASCPKKSSLATSGSHTTSSNAPASPHTPLAASGVQGICTTTTLPHLVLPPSLAFLTQFLLRHQLSLTLLLPLWQE